MIVFIGTCPGPIDTWNEILLEIMKKWISVNQGEVCDLNLEGDS